MGKKKGEFTCQEVGCGHTYTQKTHLQRHIKVTHLKETTSISRCPVEGCGKVFSYAQNMKKHVRRIHENNYRCEPCGLTFRKHHLLKIHTSYKHLGIPPYQCSLPECGMRFVKNENLKAHMKRHEMYKCKVDGCTAVLDKWSTFRKHMLLMHPIELVCSTCKKTFKCKSNLRQHEQVHNNKDRSVYMCPIEGCPKYYSQQRNLNNHIRSFHEKKLFECTHEDCERKYTTQRRLNDHVRLHNPNSSVPKKKKKLVTRKPRKDKGISKTPIATIKERLLPIETDSAHSFEEDTKVIKNEPEVIVEVLKVSSDSQFTTEMKDATDVQKDLRSPGFTLIGQEFKSNYTMRKVESYHGAESSDSKIKIKQLPISTVQVES